MTEKKVFAPPLMSKAFSEDASQTCKHSFQLSIQTLLCGEVYEARGSHSCFLVSISFFLIMSVMVVVHIARVFAKVSLSFSLLFASWIDTCFPCSFLLLVEFCSRTEWSILLFHFGLETCCYSYVWLIHPFQTLTLGRHQVELCGWIWWSFFFFSLNMSLFGFSSMDNLGFNSEGRDRSSLGLLCYSASLLCRLNCTPYSVCSL